MYHESVGKFPERTQNMYLTYILLLSAVSKLKYNLDDLQLGVQENENLRAKTLLSNFYSSLPKISNRFVTKLFAINPNQADHLKVTFRNMAKLMDCVSCERCRLWGKVQIYGVGTALKILTSSDVK